MAATAYSHQVSHGYIGAGDSYSESNAYTGDAQDGRRIDVPDSSTDLEVDFVLDVSAISAIWIRSDQNVTLETNNGGSPDDTISLLANKPYVWVSDSYFTNKLTTDITALFFTNASGSAAVVQIGVVYDSTSPS